MARAHFPCLSCSPRQTEAWLSTKGYGNAEQRRAQGRGQAGAKAISMTEEKPSSGISMSQGRDRLHRWVNGAAPGRRLSLPTMPHLWAPERCWKGRGCTHNLGSLHGNSPQSREGVPGKPGDTEGHHTMSPGSTHTVGSSPRDKRRDNTPHSTLIPPELGPSLVPAMLRLWCSELGATSSSSACLRRARILTHETTASSARNRSARISCSMRKL